MYLYKKMKTLFYPKKKPFSKSLETFQLRTFSIFIIIFIILSIDNFKMCYIDKKKMH